MRVLHKEAPVKPVHATPLGGRPPGRAQRAEKGRFWPQWPSYAAPATYLGLFMAGGPLLERLDPEMDIPDAGLLRLLPLAMLVVEIARRAASGLYKPLTEALEKLPPARRALYYGCLYLAYFWGVIWTVVALLVVGVH